MIWAVLTAILSAMSKVVGWSKYLACVNFLTTSKVYHLQKDLASACNVLE